MAGHRRRSGADPAGVLEIGRRRERAAERIAEATQPHQSARAMGENLAVALKLLPADVATQILAGVANDLLHTAETAFAAAESVAHGKAWRAAS